MADEKGEIGFFLNTFSFNGYNNIPLFHPYCSDSFHPSTVITVRNITQDWFLVMCILVYDERPNIFLCNAPLPIIKFVRDVLIVDHDYNKEMFFDNFKGKWVKLFWPAVYAEILSNSSYRQSPIPNQVQKLLFDAKVAIRQKDWNTAIIQSVVCVESYLRSIYSKYSSYKEEGYSKSQKDKKNRSTLSDFYHLIPEFPNGDIWISNIVGSLVELRNKIVHGCYYGKSEDAIWAYNNAKTIITKMLNLNESLPYD